MSTLNQISDSDLEMLQFKSFSYFLHETNPNNGLVIDKTETDWPASIAATGFALASYPTAVEHGFITRTEAVKIILTTLRFLWNSQQGTESDATGYRGFYYHFLNMIDGKRAWKCELSTIDTAFLIAGVLTSGAYFDAENCHEQEIRTLANELYLRVDWQWALNGGETITHGWKPESRFLEYRWQGYNEAILLYILGLGSPTHPLPKKSYTAWASTYKWENCYDYEYLYSSPLFAHQLSHIWIDFRDIQDSFMKEKRMDYFENSRRATHIQQRYAINNPHKFVGYSHLCWGITASNGPGPGILQIDGVGLHFFGYTERGVPFGPDDGTVAPWAVVASLPFAPEIVLPTLYNYIHQVKLTKHNPYGFKATFNPTYPVKSDNPFGWVSPWHYGINQGPIILMIENYRSGLVWELMSKCPYIVSGLVQAGFKGGWL